MNVVTIPTSDGEHWMEQLIYEDAAMQMVQRSGDTLAQIGQKSSDVPEATSTHSGYFPQSAAHSKLRKVTSVVSGMFIMESATTKLDMPSSSVPAVVPSITYQTLKGKPRKTPNGKPIPTNRIRTCRVCGRHFFSPLSDLKRHMLVHTGEKPFSCDECGASFRQRGTLKAHKIEIHGSKNHLCPQCGVRFALPEDLQHHMRFHSSKRRHNCQFCKFCGKTSNSLRHHMRMHKSGRGFQCIECGVQFSTRRKLTSHSQTHVGGQVFRCNQCEATFPDRRSLKDHKDWHLLQSQSVQFCCSVCGIQFTTERKLTAHLCEHHAGEAVFKCNQCEMTFLHRNSLRNHKDWHRLQTQPHIKQLSISNVQPQPQNNAQRNIESHSHAQYTVL